MKGTKEPASVEEALNLYWSDKSLPGHVPDYSGFEDWIRRRLDSLKSGVPLPLHALQGSHVELPHELLRAAEAGGVIITPDGAAPDLNRFAKWNGKQSRLKRFNKSKLLLSYFKNATPRWREVLLSLAKADLSSKALLRTSSQSEHRIAFFDAVVAGDELTAFKLVGRLREEAHDPGEVAFLEATASFHSDRFDEAVKLTREVPTDAVDWPRAFMLKLEALAYLGDFAPIEEELHAHPTFLFPEYFIRYICQIAIENGSMPDNAFERASHILQDTVGLSQPGSGVFQMWNRYSCQLGVRFMEQMRDASLTEEALRQTGGEGEPFEDLLGSLLFRQIQHALALDTDLASRLAQVSSDEAYTEIVKRLMNYGSPGRSEYFQALATQWRIGQRHFFLANVLVALDSLGADSSTEARQVIVWAYQEAKFSGRFSDAERIRVKLADIPDIADKLFRIDSVNADDRLEQALSPMARLAWRSANWDLTQATKDALLWKDAGMISLGFFRIIELELNERLIAPALQNLDMERLEANLFALKTREADKQTKDAIAVWERLLPQLRRVKEERKGLELGALEMLLGKAAKLTGPDAALKSPIHSEIARRLTSAGADAFEAGRLASLVDVAAREKFRNPPAHSRYVALPVARECKEYVDIVLQQVIEFIASGGEAATMH